MSGRLAVKLGSIVFDEPLYVREYDNPDETLAEMGMSAEGTHIFFASDIKTPYITLESRGNGWQNQNTVEAIKTAIKNYDLEYILEFQDGSTEKTRIAIEKKPSFSPLFDCSIIYNIELTLAKIL